MHRARSVPVSAALAIATLASASTAAAPQIAIDTVTPHPEVPVAPDPSLAPVGPPTPVDVRFFPATPYAVGANPIGAAAGDFDLDGDLDLAVTVSSPESIRLLRNQGDGTFLVDGSIALPDDSLPSHVAALDSDGDGDLDLAVTLAALDEVRLFLNDGAQFSVGPVLAVGDEPRHLDALDLDGNGLPDLAVANRAGDSVTVLLNQDGTLFEASTHATGDDLREIEIGDVTDDGLADIVVAGYGSSSVEILVNLGNGFANLTTLPLGTLQPSGVAIEDLDGDGVPDVAASLTDSGVEFVAVFLGVGGGQFAQPIRYALEGAGACTLVAADFDSDFDVDLAAALTATNEVAVVRNDGAGAFSMPRRFDVGLAPCFLLTAPIDADPSFDLVSVDGASGTVSVLLNRTDACGVRPFCTAKTTSGGQTPEIGWTGTPSASTDDLVIRLAGATPNALAILFYSRTGENAEPFLGGTLCARMPLFRVNPHLSSPLGTNSWTVPVHPGMAGETRWYQIWFRDPKSSFDSGLTAALEVHFCP